MGILKRWRQFGRRYFWSHLLLGMVAATLGVPVADATPRDQLQSPASVNLRTVINDTCLELATIRDACRRSVYQRDHWQQHTVRSAIRHLSWALTLHDWDEAIVEPIQAQQVALLDSLSVLLTQKRISSQGNISFPPASTQHSLTFQSGLWIAQIQGIRAGPLLPKVS